MTENEDLTAEEILADDKAYWLNLELEGLSIEQEWGRLYPEENKQFYE